MRIAVISDTHGNLAALDAVLAELEQTGPWDEVVMGGDFAFGGPFPAECIARIHDRSLRAVRGNTDEFIVFAATDGRAPDHSIPPGPAQLALARWSADRLSLDQVDYLSSLPLEIQIGSPDGYLLSLVHATPWSAHPAVRPDSPEEEMRAMLDAVSSQALAYGHIHLQYQRMFDGRLLVAVGSVGMPFDGDQRAAYTVFTRGDDGWTGEFRRVPYDVDRVIAAASASGSPGGEGFAATLRSARPPQT